MTMQVSPLVALCAAAAIATPTAAGAQQASQGADVQCWPEVAASLAAPQIFERLDLDDDTNLSEGEFRPCAGGPAPAFRVLDDNGDDLVSREEFIAAALGLAQGAREGGSPTAALDDEQRRTGNRRVLGVEIQPLSEALARALGAPSEEGALVAGVVRGSAAAEAGLTHGDVIVSFAGTQISEARELSQVVREAPAGQPLEIVFLRSGERRKINAKLRDGAAGLAAGATEPISGEPSPIGITLSRLTPKLRDHLDLRALADGAVIVQVAEGSPAEQVGLRPGDVVVQVGDVPVVTPEDAANQIGQARSAETGQILLRINRQGSHRFVAVPD